MKREYYSNSISNFLNTPETEILGELALNNEYLLMQTQRLAWSVQIDILRKTLKPYNGTIYFEYSIPRIGKRVDVVLLIDSVIFVIEFKIGEKFFSSHAIDQVWDYALDLKNFHETSHAQYIAPLLIASEATSCAPTIISSSKNDKLLLPIVSGVPQLSSTIKQVLTIAEGKYIDKTEWESGRYCPTPTIIEAAMALYNNHSVREITRRDSSATNLSITSNTISEIIKSSKENSRKSICLVTGVPGAGKTLVGLDIATKHINSDDDLYSVYLSGNGPLVKVLCEALSRDKVSRANKIGSTLKISEARRDVKSFIQNVHNFRDACLFNIKEPPIEHVAIFDEAQRAWNLEQTSSFMRSRKNYQNFNHSEPKFLISCLDRHPDWAVIVCLIGGGQEIHKGEAGIGEWIHSINNSFPEWDIYISSRLKDSEYNSDEALKVINNHQRVTHCDDLHLAVSMRSFRAENVSLFIKQILDLDVNAAQYTLGKINKKYPIVITRNLEKGKKWLKKQARGSERYGIVASSQAERLKPYAIDVKSPMEPIHWFLNHKDDVRSSYYLEHVATEFHVQGLELDWVCITWDADFRYSVDGWGHYSFKGNKWQNINKVERKQYLKNAYRVLLTRARQGMVIFVPEGDQNDHTRRPEFYDETFEYLKRIGLSVI